MKLIQLNIWQGKLLKSVIDYLNKENAEIVCLQEVFSCKKEIAVLDMLDSLEKIQGIINYPFVFFEPTFSFDIMGTRVKFGNAILSKHELKNKRVVFTNNSYHHVDDWDNHPPNTRNALLSDVEIDGQEVTLVNHHGFHDLNPLGNEQTVKAMKVLVSEIKGIENPIVFSGDLNITAESPTMRLFDNWMIDLTAINNVRDTLTRFGKVRNVPCDHILITPSVAVDEFFVSDALVSDHAPVVLNFSI